MIWILIGFATWNLLNAPLPLLSIKPILLDSFFFYNFNNESQWMLAAVVLLRALSQFAGIALYLQWKHCRSQNKDD